MKDYSNIEKYPIGEWDIGLWFEITEREHKVPTELKLLYQNPFYLHFIDNLGNVTSFVRKLFEVKRLSPQPKFEPKDNDIILGILPKEKRTGSLLGYKYNIIIHVIDNVIHNQPFVDASFFDYTIKCNFNKWLATHSIDDILKYCPQCADKDFWRNK